MKQQVEEERLVNAANVYRQMYNQVPNEIIKVLKNGSKIRKQGLTPFYVMDTSKLTFFVTSEEMMDKKFN